MNIYLEKIALSGSIKSHLKELGAKNAKAKKEQDQVKNVEKNISSIMQSMASRLKNTKTEEMEYKNMVKGTESLGKLFTTLRKSSQPAAGK